MINYLFKKIAHIIFRPRSFSNKNVKKFAQKVNNEKILELGSGKSEFYSVKKYFDASNQFIQSDINPIYKRKIIDATKMNFKNEFDIVLCLNVLEHVFDYQKAINNIYNALKPSGIGIFVLPVFYPLHDEPHDYWRFTYHSLQKILNQFSKIDIKTNGPKKYPFSYYIKVVK